MWTILKKTNSKKEPDSKSQTIGNTYSPEKGRKAKKSQNSVFQKAMFVLGLIICVVFGTLLLCNLIIIIKGTIHPDKPPSVFGLTPMVVQSGSMSGSAPDHIEVGDLIFVGNIDPEKLEVGNIIAFMENKHITTHRIVAIRTAEDGGLLFSTKGDANNTEDEEFVTADNLIGIYRGRIPRLGDFAMLLQQPLGRTLSIGIPLLAFILYNIILRKRYADRESKKAAEMETELERLRALTGENNAKEEEAAANKDKKDI